MKRVLLAVYAMLILGGMVPGAKAAVDPSNAFWGLTLEGFFPGESKGAVKRLNAYLVRRDGRWAGGIGTPTFQGHPQWNSALMLCDPIGLSVTATSITGTLSVTLVPDPWVPKDQKVRVANVSVHGSIMAPATSNETASVAGTWRATIPGTPEELAAAQLSPVGEGRLTGGAGGVAPPDMADVSYDLVLYGLIRGVAGEEFQRRRALSLGFTNGTPVSARLGQLDMRHHPYDYVPIGTPAGLTLTADTISGTVSFEAQTLDGDMERFELTLDGRRVAGWVAGTWHSNGRSGFFRGNVNQGAWIPETAKPDSRPWFVSTPGFAPVAPGEHPRLFFRKSDLATLRKRAETPEGAAIVKRLRTLLNGKDGESIPTRLNPAKKAYEANGFKAETGAYTISHAAGFGFLYQLTGESRYADLARQCVDLGFAGQRSSDDRYAWVAPGGELRAGPSIGWTAAAYDLCYDAWPEDYRRRVALAIQNYADTAGGEWNKAEGITLRKMVLTPRHGPRSNHYGAVAGGCGLAVLAIRGDPGTDGALLDKYLSTLERSVISQLSDGWVDGGYYSEGWGASRVGTQGAFLCFLQALKVAQGHDYLNTDHLNASCITMVPRCSMVLGPPGYFPYRSNMGGTYGNPGIGSREERSGFSHGGYFSEGFGAIAEAYKPALLWTYNHVFKAGDEVCDTLSPYPHRAMLALINWPFDSPERNPAEVLPLATRDHLYDYFVFRNRWQDTNDVVTTVLIRQPDGTKPRSVMTWGLGGLRFDFGEPPRNVKVAHYQPGLDGSAVLTAGGWSLVVDYSRAAGVDALLVSTGNAVKPPAASPKVRALTVGRFSVLLLSATGVFPDPKVNGDTLAIGSQRITFMDGNLLLQTFRPAAPSP